MLVVLVVFALVWAGAVIAAVIGSAPTGGATIVVLGRELFEPGTPEGVWLLCALVASAAATLAWAFGAWGRRRHRRRMTEELDARWAQRSHEATAEEARGRLLESRERELDEVIHTLTAQRDALLGELAALRSDAPSVVEVPEVEPDAAGRAG